MATPFYNQATLTYNGRSLTSNITAGEILEVLSANKTPAETTYSQGDEITYTINVNNTGATAVTDVRIDDNLGATATPGSQTPLTVNTETLLVIVGGTPVTNYTLESSSPLILSGITLPANTTLTVVYKATVNEFAPAGIGGIITNSAVISSTDLAESTTVSATITASNTPDLTITKSLNPTTVPENGQITYTFLIQNNGNADADAAANVAVADTFTPILNPVSVALDGTPISSPADYTYNTATGAFATTPGVITVPAASYTRDPATGAYIRRPGSATLTVTGNI